MEVWRKARFSRLVLIKVDMNLYLKDDWLSEIADILFAIFFFFVFHSLLNDNPPMRQATFGCLSTSLKLSGSWQSPHRQRRLEWLSLRWHLLHCGMVLSMVTQSEQYRFLRSVKYHLALSSSMRSILFGHHKLGGLFILKFVPFSSAIITFIFDPLVKLLSFCLLFVVT